MTDSFPLADEAPVAIEFSARSFQRALLIAQIEAHDRAAKSLRERLIQHDDATHPPRDHEGSCMECGYPSMWHVVPTLADRREELVWAMSEAMDHPECEHHVRHGGCIDCRAEWTADAAIRMLG